jgi:hypothetical protein
MAGPAEAVHVVRSGDTLSSLAARAYGHASDWAWLWSANKTTVTDPNLIYAGQALKVPAAPPPPGWVPALVPLPRPPADSQPRAGDYSQPRAAVGATTATVLQDAPAAPARNGTYDCAGLEELWGAAGGNPAAAFTAAEIAMAESGGNPDAVSPTDDYGLWQVNGSHGPLATLNPQANARAAVQISGDGTNWSPWTTFETGAYAGRC